MKKILIGLAVLGVALVIALSVRQGLRDEVQPVTSTATAVAAPLERDTGPRGPVVDPETLERTDRGPLYPADGPARLPETPPAQRPADQVARDSGAGVVQGSEATAAQDPEAAASRDQSSAQVRDSGTPQTQDPEYARVLRQAARVYADVRSFQADFSQRSMNPILRNTVSSSGTLYQRRPDRFLMRFSEPAGDLIVSDGSHFWVYYPSVDRKQVIRTPATQGAAGGVDLHAQFVGDPLERFVVTPEGREEVAGRSAHVLLLVPREPLGYRSLKVWIDAQDHLIRRFEVTEENGIVRHFELSNLKLNPSLADDLFRFTVPEGAHVVERG